MEENQRIIGEIVIPVEIIVNSMGVVTNKDEVSKCPFCSIGTGKVFCRGNSEEGAVANIGFRCESCNKQWNLRFRNPVLLVKI